VGHGATTGSAMEPALDFIAEIVGAWTRGAGHTMDLACVVSAGRRRLRYGEWSKLWQSGRMPFSKRKGEMLVVIGERLDWIDAQIFAHLPIGWSILYQLAQLERAVFEKLLGEAVIHPKLTLREARELAAGFHRREKRSAGINVRRRLRQFSDFVERTLSQWKAEDRKLAKIKLTGLIEQIDAAECESATGHPDHLLNRNSSNRGRIVVLAAVTGHTVHQPKWKL